MSKIMQLSDIRIDGGTQSRERLCEDTVADYSEAMKAGDQFPPIVVFCDGSDNWLADGFHRFHAARKAGLSELQADMRTGTRQDALWHAIGANKANAQRMSRGDVRHAVELALRTWPDRSQVEIARQVGCAQQYVSRLKSEFTTSGELADAPATVTGKDGKVYPTSKPRKQAVEAAQEAGKLESSPITHQPPPTKPQPRGVALGYSMKAISYLQQIPPDDALRDEALDDVIRWINFNR